MMLEQLITNKKTLHLAKIQNYSIDKLISLANSLNIKDTNNLNKQDLIFVVLKTILDTYSDLKIIADGVLELHENGFGFLRGQNSSYLPGADDIYIAPNQIKRFKLRTGDIVSGVLRLPKENEKYFGLIKILQVNDEDPEVSITKTVFENLVPVYPDKQFVLESKEKTIDATARIIDLFAPIGKGQRGLIVAPPKAGKTELLKNIALSIRKNYPDHKLIVLLIDERPEEVTEFRKVIDKTNPSNSDFSLNNAEVIASTFDEPAERHVQVANMVIEHAKRQVEHKKDIIILLDSITRLARAYNIEEKSSGKTLSGGIDANSLYKPKKFFGAARNIEGNNAGSLTIIATALVDTGSRMDEVIFEEFKGTGNMELVLSRQLAEHRIFPAIDIIKSGTRRDDKLFDQDTYLYSYQLRNELAEYKDEFAVMTMVKDLIKNSIDNKNLVSKNIK